MFNHMIGNITKIRLRSYICASSDVFLPSISSLNQVSILKNGKVMAIFRFTSYMAAMLVFRFAVVDGSFSLSYLISVLL